MLDYHSRSHTDYWRGTERIAARDASDPAAMTMARPVAAEYAWSAETVVAGPTVSSKRPQRRLGPIAAMSAGAVAAIAATLLAVFGGGQATSTAVATPTVSTPVTDVRTAPPAPTVRPVTTASAPRHQPPRHGMAASATATEPTEPTDSRQHGDQWRPSHDSTWDWRSFLPHVDSSDDHHDDYDRNYGRSHDHRDGHSPDRHTDSSQIGSRS